ncbi:MAG: DUF2096 domain-containing protein [Candidatus Bathyarchaeota archaeon]|nr:DUF2096 domain-containing protein [Candidatus Bathyarchaeota archaeon]
MSNAATWKILEDMTITLTKKGVEIPANIMVDLRAAKCMLEISPAEKGSGESLAKSQECLDIVEAFIINKTEEIFGAEYTDTFLRELEETKCPVCPTCSSRKEDENKFVAGVPRNQKWIRVEPIEELPTERLRQLAQELNLSIIPQEDGKLVVYGESEDIKTYVKKMVIPKQ